jgi:hypothetical protein
VPSGSHTRGVVLRPVRGDLALVAPNLALVSDDLAPILPDLAMISPELALVAANLSTRVSLRRECASGAQREGGTEHERIEGLHRGAPPDQGCLA